MENYIKIQIKAILENVSTVRTAITSFVSNYNIPLNEIMDIKTAVSEAVTNSIEHGYNNDNENIININGYILKENDVNKIKIEIIDEGIGIDNLELALTPMYTSKPDTEHAGLGFTVMQSFMDEIIVDSNLKKGTCITLIKNIKSTK